jgi:hypothetical protein
VSDFPGEPIAADPVEVLAYALWNDGKKDEAIAVLERQIALEKKLARGGALPAPVERPEMTLFPLPEVVKAPVRSPQPPARAANQNEAESRGARYAPDRARLSTRTAKALPARLDPVTSWPRPSRRMALLSGGLLLLLGAAGLWASADRDGTVATSPPQQATTQESQRQPESRVSVEPPRNGKPAEAQLAVPAEPAAAVPQPAPIDLPGDSEEPPAEELPTQEVLAEEPPAEDLPPPELEAVVPDARVPRSRAEPPAPEVAQSPEPAQATPPRAAVRERPAQQPRQAARGPASRPAADTRSERSRRLAERREAAERYVARRRAEAERSAAAKRRGAARVPDEQGPRILLGGNGLPN